MLLPCYISNARLQHKECPYSTQGAHQDLKLSSQSESAAILPAVATESPPEDDTSGREII